MPFPKLPDIQGETIAELVESMQKQRKEMQWLLQSLDTMNVKELNAAVVNAGVLNAERVAIGSSSTYEPGYNPDGLRTEMNNRFEVTDEAFTSQISAVTTTATGAKNSADAANALLADLANDNKLTGVEKQETKKQWDIIVAEKPTISAQATTYGVTTELTNFNNSYTTLATYLTPLLADLASTSDIVATTFRTNFKDYFDKKAILIKITAESARTLANTAQTAANTAQTAANTAQTAANTANTLLSDIANDDKITPTEKQDTKKEWDIIVSEKVTIDAQATTYAITTEKTTYGNAYTALSGYITPLLSSLTTTTDIVGTVFRSTFKTYYDARTALLKKISDLAKGLADTANATANTLRDTTVPALAGRVSTAESTISQHATEIGLRVTQETFDNLEVGGRNLVLNSSKEFRNCSVTTYTGALSAETNTVYLDDYNILVGDTITFRLYLDCTSNVLKGGRARISYYRPDNTYSAITGNIVSIGEKGYSTVSLTIPSGFDRVVLLIQNANTSATDAEIIKYKEAKLEKGNMATGWTPAPEDVDEGIATLKGRVDTAETKITPTAIVSTVTSSTTYTNDLGAKVGTTSVISSINQTAEAIKISASKIDINGAVTFSSFDTAMKGVLSNSDSSIINANPYFLDWTSTVPAGYASTVGTGMSKVASGNGMGNSVQFVVGAGSNHYLNPIQVTTSPYYQYVTTEITFMLSSGTIDGAGILFRHEATTDISANIHLKDAIASPILNKWHTVTKIIKVPSATPVAGFTGYSLFLMGGWTGYGTVTAKTIQFDGVKCRPSSEQEINAYETGVTVSAKATTWDRAGNINSDGTYNTNKLNGTLTDGQIASGPAWNTAKDDTIRWKFSGKTTIDGGKIETDSVTAIQIKANTLTTNQIISTNPNLISDVDSFEQYNGRMPNGAMSLLTTCIGSDEEAYHGSYSLKTVSSGANSYKYLHPSADTNVGWMKLQVGKQYIISAYVKTTSTVATTVNLAFHPREGKTATTAAGGSVTATKTLVNTDGWVRMYALSPAISATNPYAAFYVRNVSTGITTYWDAIQVEEYETGNTLPSDFSTGGTTTINGSNIITNTVTATQINVATLSALSANLGSITAGDITGVTLNLAGGKFVVDSGGNVTFGGSLNGATGSFAGTVTAANLVITATQSNSSQLTLNTTGAPTRGYAVLSAYSDAVTPLRIQIGSKASSGFSTTIGNAFEIQILAANVTLGGNTTVNGDLKINDELNPQNNITLLAGKSLTWATYGGTINMVDNTYIRFNKALYTTGIYNTVGSLPLRGETGVDLVMGFSGESPTDLSLGNDGTPRVSSMAMYNRTGGLSANMNISSAGTISRSTSATKYKLSIEPIIIDNYAERILELKPKSWYDKSASERYADYLTKEANGEHIDLKKVDIPVVKRHNGLIAEDLVEVGLSEYVSYGEVKEDGSQEVEGLEYDRLWTLLIPIVKSQKERLEALEIKMIEMGN